MKKATLVFALAALLGSVRAQGWVDVTPAMPGGSAGGSATTDSTMCYDPVRGVSWLFKSGVETWSWDGSTWSTVPLGTSISGLPKQAVWDSVGQRVIVMAATGNGPAFYAWDGVTLSLLPSPQLVTTSIEQIRMTFDDARGVLFLNWGVNNQPSLFSEFDGTSWVQAFPAIQPPTPSSGGFHEIVQFYDPTRSRIALLLDWSTNILSNTAPQYWEWDGSTWSQRFGSNLDLAREPAATAAQRGLTMMVSMAASDPAPKMWTVSDGQIEQVFLTSWPAMRTMAHLVYDSGRDRFVMHGGLPLLGGNYSLADTWELDLGPNATFTAYGAGCPNSTGLAPEIEAQIGTTPAVNSVFNIQVSGLPFTGPAFMWLGFSNANYAGLSLPFNLAVLGAPQCDVLVSPDQLYAIPNVLGTSFWSLAIPNVPGFTFYNQAIAFDPAANSLGLVFSNASEAIVGQ